MTSADILVTEDKNPGSTPNRGCSTQQLGNSREARDHKEPDSPFEQYVIDAITALGFEAVPQVGVAGYFIDIGVRHQDYPHGFLMGVEWWSQLPLG